MRLALFVLAIAALGAQQRGEPPVLPAGQFCQHRVAGRQPPAHPCACQRHCSEDDSAQVVEDAQCKQWCHADHCHCPVKGCD